MLLSYIDDLLHTDSPFDFTFQIYQTLIEKWIDREAQKHTGNVDSYRRELYAFSTRVAIDLYQKRTERGGLFIPADEMKDLAEKHGVKLDEIDVRSRSLLNRDASGNYKFSHRSIQEYFLAQKMKADHFVPSGVADGGFDQALVFLKEMRDEARLRRWRDELLLNAKSAP
ncbi:MAG: hypothetical protein NTW07_00810 [candidate division Zixibacteria bacterium]|nr:hypothetical protein [candidate division Zixibacteria bacterium]